MFQRESIQRHIHRLIPTIVSLLIRGIAGAALDQAVLAGIGGEGQRLRNRLDRALLGLRLDRRTGSGALVPDMPDSVLVAVKLEEQGELRSSLS